MGHASHLHLPNSRQGRKEAEHSSYCNFLISFMILHLNPPYMSKGEDGRMELQVRLWGSEDWLRLAVLIMLCCRWALVRDHLHPQPVTEASNVLDPVLR